MLTVVVFLIWLTPLGEFNSLHLLPVGAEGVVAIAEGALEAFFSFLGFEALLVFYPLIANQQKVLKVTLIALVFITLLYAGNVILTFGVLGVEHTMLQKWPVISYLRVGSLPFARRVDTVVLFFWTAQCGRACPVLCRDLQPGCAHRQAFPRYLDPGLLAGGVLGGRCAPFHGPGI